MKKWTFFLGLYFCVALLLGGCAMEQAAGSAPASSVSGEDEVPVGPPQQSVTCRVVAVGENGTLTLAGFGQEGVYTLSAPELEARPGQLVDVGYDTLLETYPAQFSGGVTAVPRPGADGFADRCALFLRVLNDLWVEDTGLNGGVEQVGVDLSATSLSESERSAVAWVFAAQHGAELAEGTWQELADGGYIAARPLEGSDACYYQWENGCFYSITEQEMEGTYSLTPVTFDAEKWRSGTGAYYYCGCTAIQSAQGQWSDYTVGAHAIS